MENEKTKSLWGSELAKAVEKGCIGLLRGIESNITDVGSCEYFDPNPTITETGNGTVFEWKTSQFEFREMFVRGELGIVDNDYEFKVMILVNGKVETAQISKAIFDGIKAEFQKRW